MDLSVNNIGTFIHHLSRLDGIIPVSFIDLESILLIEFVFITWLLNCITFFKSHAFIQLMENEYESNGIVAKYPSFCISAMHNI